MVAVQLISGAFHDLKELGTRPRERSRELVEWARTVVTQRIHPDITVSLNVVLAANGLADLVVYALEEYRSETSK